MHIYIVRNGEDVYVFDSVTNVCRYLDELATEICSYIPGEGMDISIRVENATREEYKALGGE